MAFFCEKTGARIVAPGVSKAVDPTNGVDECIELADGSERIITPGGEPPAEPPKGADKGTTTKGSNPKGADK